jgi:hypothetical protein
MMALRLRELADVLDENKRLAKIAQPEVSLDPASVIAQLPLRRLRLEALGFLSRQRWDTAAAGGAGSISKSIHRSSARPEIAVRHVGSPCHGSSTIRFFRPPLVCLTIPDRLEVTGPRGISTSGTFQDELEFPIFDRDFGLPRNSDAIPPARGRGAADSM